MNIFNPEGCIISFIYINRIIAITDMPLIQTNWRPIIFLSILISQKIWDEAFISNKEFSALYPFFESWQIANLEIKFIELMKYNTIIKFSTYAKFFLELKTLLPEENILKPLDSLSFKSFEQKTQYLQEKFKNKSRTEKSSKMFGENTNYVIN
jgi:hypothetical protein